MRRHENDQKFFVMQKQIHIIQIYFLNNKAADSLLLIDPLTFDIFPFKFIAEEQFQIFRVRKWDKMALNAFTQNCLWYSTQPIQSTCSMFIHMPQWKMLKHTQTDQEPKHYTAADTLIR